MLAPLRSRWQQLRRWLVDRRHARMLAAAQQHSLMTRRGDLASSSEVARHAVGGLELECYRLQINGAQGVGLSVYIGPEELQRFDCLGTTGHFHYNFQQSRWIADGAVTRLAFGADTVAEQVSEGLYRLRRDLINLQRGNWRPQVRQMEVGTSDVEAAANWAEDSLQRLLRDPTTD